MEWLVAVKKVAVGGTTAQGDGRTPDSEQGSVNSVTGTNAFKRAL